MTVSEFAERNLTFGVLKIGIAVPAKMAKQLYKKSKVEVKNNLSLLIAHLSSKLEAIKDDEDFAQCKIVLRLCQHYAKPLKFAK